MLGRIVAPFGVLGWLRIHPFGDDPLGWKAIPHWLLSPDADVATDAWQMYVPATVKVHGGGLLAKLQGVDDRGSAEALTGCYIGALRSDLPLTGKDEYYWRDLIGLEVQNLQGMSLGHVDSLLETGANDVLVVVDGKNRRLLPFVGKVVVNVDTVGRLILVDWGIDW